MNRYFLWAIVAVTKPSCLPHSVPLLDSAYWKCVVSPPSALANRRLRDLEHWETAAEDTDSSNPDLLVGSPSTLTLTSYVGQGGTCAAFRGTWHGVSVVVKYIQHDYSTPFVREAQAYLGSLAHLRGTVVPEFFGLYRSDYFALLVFEDCGNTISDWDELNLWERCLTCYIHLCD
jgi:hypothetical protein